MRGVDQINNIIAKKDSCSEGIGCLLQVLVIPTDEKGLPVFGKHIIDKDQITGSPGRNHAPDLDIQHIAGPKGHVQTPDIRVHFFGYGISQQVTFKQERERIKEASQFHLRPGLADAQSILIFIIHQSAAQAGFRKTEHFNAVIIVETVGQ